MSFSYTTGVVDNDADGTTGVGTIFYVDITIDDVTKRHTWGLLDQLQGKFNYRDLIRPYVETENKKKVEADAKVAEQKKIEAEHRKKSIVEDPAIVAIIKDVLASEVKSVEQFKAGKEKALNALVGKVIGKGKSIGVTVDAFNITHLLKQKLM